MSKTVEIECAYCKKKRMRYASSVTSKHQFCSRECGRLFHRRAYAEHRSSMTRRPRPPATRQG